ncbi:MAG: Tfp pilus assembly protein FimT/FimU [Gammaproteobacteria bacterium]
MPTSATGRSTDRPAAGRGAGFTLVELLVVICVLGVVLGMAALSFNRGGREDLPRDFAHRLLVQCRVLASEAVFRGRPLGIDLGADAWRVLAWERGEWRPDAAPGSGGVTRLAPGLALNGVDGGTYAAADVPDLVLMPDGDFRLHTVIVVDRHSPARAMLTPDAGPGLFRLLDAPP